MEEDWRLKAMLDEGAGEEGLSLGEAREVRARAEDESRGREETVRRRAVAGMSPMLDRGKEERMGWGGWWVW